MALFFFNIYNDDVTMDDEGADLPDVEAARIHAVTAVRSLAAASVAEGHFVGSHRIEIEDEQHRFVMAVRFGDAVEVQA